LIRILGRVLGGTLSAALLVASAYGWYEYRSLDKGLHRLHLSNLSVGDRATPAGSAQNILIVGVDSRDGLSYQEQQRLLVGDAASLSADTIMVVHVPADGSRATMISIPRDSFVRIPGGFLKNKINAAYADGFTYAPRRSSPDERRAAGADTLVGAVRALTGLRIDHYVQVGFGGFYTIAKAIGGIHVNLCAATNDTYAVNVAHGLGRVGSGFKMTAGEHDLTPVQALEFVRQRHNLAGGDLAREKRQQYFITAAFNKITSAGVLLNPGKLSALIKAVTGAFYVDDDGFSLLDLASQLADLGAGNISGYTVPIEGAGTRVVGGAELSVDVVRPERVRAFVRRVLAAPVSPVSPVSPASPGQPASAVASSAPPPAAHQRSNPTVPTPTPSRPANCIN
jgi:LCP family protein required for cell wall assembly